MNKLNHRIWRNYVTNGNEERFLFITSKFRFPIIKMLTKIFAQNGCMLFSLKYIEYNI